MPSKDASERRLIASIGGSERAARYDGVAVTQRARDCYRASFAKRVRAHAAERGETLSEAEVERRAEALRRAHFRRLALASVQARQRRKAG